MEKMMSITEMVEQLSQTKQPHFIGRNGDFCKALVPARRFDQIERYDISNESLCNCGAYQRNQAIRRVMLHLATLDDVLGKTGLRASIITLISKERVVTLEEWEKLRQ